MDQRGCAALHVTQPGPRSAYCLLNRCLGLLSRAASQNAVLSVGILTVLACLSQVAQ